MESKAVQKWCNLFSPKDYSCEGTVPRIRIMQDNVAFLPSKGVPYPFSTRAHMGMILIFHTTTKNGYRSPLLECCSIILHLSAVTQREHCAHSPLMLLQVLFPFYTLLLIEGTF